MTTLSKNTPVNDRAGYLGGSDAGAILGVSPWRTPYQLWCEKVGIEMPPNLDNLEFIHFGTLLEPVVAQEFALRTKKKVQVARQLYQHRKHPFLAGHIDRRVLNEPAFLECKTTNAFDYRKWGPDGGGPDDIPEQYLAQVDHYMMLRDYEYCYVATLIGGSAFRCYLIHRDPVREKKLLDAELHFWNAHVLPEDPPPITNEKDSKHRWKDVVEHATMPIDQAARTKIVHLASVAEQRKALEKEEKALRDWLFPLFQDKQYLSDATSGDLIARLSSYSFDHFDAEAAAKNKAAAKWVKKFTQPRPAKRLKILI